MQSVDSTLSFNLNRSNILLEQLTISDDILLLGGTELDVALLYREMEKNLMEMRAEFTGIQKRSFKVNQALLSSRNLLNESEDKLFSVHKTLRDHKATISAQNINITTRQNELERATESSNINSKRIIDQEVQVKEQAEKIRLQQRSVKLNRELLDSQQDMLASQELSMIRQNTTIRGQEQLLYVTSGATVLFLLVVLGLIRVSRDRKRISLVLEQRSISLAEEVRERTAEAVKSSRYYRALSEFSPVGVYQTDTHGNCLYVNERWCEYSGLTRKQAMGAGWIDAIYPDDRKNVNEQPGINFQTGGIFNSEHRYRTPGGRVKWLLGQCEAEYDTGGVLQGYLGAVIDITDQKDLQQQLRRTQKMDALGKLTGGIAHDYNNLLAIISGYAQLLEVELLDQPSLLKRIEKIMYACDRGAVLTKRLLAFSKHESAVAAQVDINSLVEYQRQMLEKTLTPRIRLELHLEKLLWPVWIDGGDMEDALVNMSINAMHAMEEGGTLLIETKNVHIQEPDIPCIGLQPGDYVFLSISDTGLGMNKETQDKLFQPFFTTKGHGGTGLGLTQVYDFIGRSKAIIGLDSTLGKGTQFSFYFPRYRGSDEEVVSKSENSNDTVRGSETILIVDDEDDILTLASEIFSKEGYKTVTASNGNEALEVLQKTSVDLLLSDIIMPGIGGHELASLVQRQYPAIKIQLVSGFSTEQHQSKTSTLLLDNLLYKPYRSQNLLERVRKLLNQ